MTDADVYSPGENYTAEVKINRDHDDVIVAGVRDPMVMDPDEARQFGQLLVMCAEELEDDE